MKILQMGVLAAVLLAGPATLSFASTNQVLVLYHGQSDVNKEAYNFLRRNLSGTNLGVTLSASQDTSAVKPGMYKAVVVLNSSMASGTDPVLQAFINGYPAKGEVFLVNLLKGSSGSTVLHQMAPTSPLGVDAVTSASTWSEGADKMTYVKMHQEWVQDLVEFLKAQK